MWLSEFMEQRPRAFSVLGPQVRRLDTQLQNTIYTISQALERRRYVEPADALEDLPGLQAFERASRDNLYFQDIDATVADQVASAAVQLTIDTYFTLHCLHSQPG